ncbi:MAG: pilus assembly protein PilB, partial [Acidobacteriota bacterium]|nr:pilus assembly protein PilB [Acidobacteriota bacterium]
DPYSFISALNCILAQRLVRVLCPKCKTPVRLTDDQLRESGLAPAGFRDRTFYENKGCPDCSGTGYQGRTAIGEVLDLSDPIREMVLERKPLSEVRKKAKAEGMTSLREAGMEKVLQGITGLRDLNKVTFVE